MVVRHRQFVSERPHHACHAIAQYLLIVSGKMNSTDALNKVLRFPQPLPPDIEAIVPDPNPCEDSEYQNLPFIILLPQTTVAVSITHACDFMCIACVALIHLLRVRGLNSLDFCRARHCTRDPWMSITKRYLTSDLNMRS